MEINKGLLPTCWGPPFWHVLHSISYVYNPSIDKQKYYDFFLNLGYILPCEECRKHYWQNLNRQELQVALESNEGMFRWVYDLHNKVNKQNGVPESKWPSYESVKEKYKSYEATCSKIPGVCSSGTIGPQKRMKIVEQFGNMNIDQLPLLITVIILAVLLFIALMYIYYIKKSK